ncbi:IS30 family transposase [Spiroplasma citri]|uniref:IS30 family transposase n=1 Tax=Spiroplasma citri TaxID=2133 RepID=A0A1J0YZZ3_SPICI|nr:IS30 family transposase [Spiroplasma citri]APE74468.1 transposase of IS30 family protein [Spiroplasma citri]QED24388.1 IS30 family transposase [Spiroplasma citri]QIA66654.1 IS30 family transposase [Spiroplasma citri]QIA68538.1 IS30 family transposase [Spiroplasma citri]QIA70411.1 IS30 family transposase [Spiroplasma citri]
MNKKKYKHFSLVERYKLKEYLISETFKKKNGTSNYSKIAKVMNKSPNTIRLEAQRLGEEYNPEKANDDYKKKRKKSIKCTTISTKVVNYVREILSKKIYSPRLIIYEYEKKYNEKFPFSHVTLYKYIDHKVFDDENNEIKKKLPFKGKKYKTKKRKDDRGQLTNIRFIDEAEHEKGTFGWLQMDCIVGKEHQSACLTITEEKSLYTICFKLNQHNSEEVNKALKSIIRNKLYKINIKGIITDQGKEFSKWKEIEKITNANVYFCDAGTPTQKAKVERINRDIREYLPKGTDFNTVTQKEINKVMKIINEKPRPSLGWLSSKEVFLQNINI